jgi:hypothetical protein
MNGAAAINMSTAISLLKKPNLRCQLFAASPCALLARGYTPEIAFGNFWR